MLRHPSLRCAGRLLESRADLRHRRFCTAWLVLSALKGQAEQG